MANEEAPRDAQGEAKATTRRSGSKVARDRAAGVGQGPPPGSRSVCRPASGPSAARVAETMQKLLDAAMVAFDRRGFHATRVNDVVDIANMSHGTFYLYFSNMSDLVRALTIEAATDASAFYGALTEAGNALDGHSRDDLRQWIGDYSKLWLRYAPLFRCGPNLPRPTRRWESESGGRFAPSRRHVGSDLCCRDGRRPEPRGHRYGGAGHAGPLSLPPRLDRPTGRRRGPGHPDHHGLPGRVHPRCPTGRPGPRAQSISTSTGAPRAARSTLSLSSR